MQWLGRRRQPVGRRSCRAIPVPVMGAVQPCDGVTHRGRACTGPRSPRLFERCLDQPADRGNDPTACSENADRRWNVVDRLPVGHSQTPVHRAGHRNRSRSIGPIFPRPQCILLRNQEGFCIVSSDSDFTPLVMRLREAEKLVIGFGEKKASEAEVGAVARHRRRSQLVGDLAERFRSRSGRGPALRRSDARAWAGVHGAPKPQTLPKEVWINPPTAATTPRPAQKIPTVAVSMSLTGSGRAPEQTPVHRAGHRNRSRSIGPIFPRPQCILL